MWGGSPGNANDNNQSFAGQGNIDILLTYNDENATPRVHLAWNRDSYVVGGMD